MKRPTINDVAADSGVSRAAVSLVLQDSSRVGPTTKERVRESMTRLGYVYNRRAADMRNQSSRTIGLVVTDVRNPYFAEFTMAIEQAAYDAGYTLLHGYSRDHSVRQQRLLKTMVEHRVDGLILLPASGTTPEELDGTLGVAGTPRVLIARRVTGYDADYCGADNTESGRVIAEHLRTIGVTSVAFLGGPSSSSARLEREEGLRTGLAFAGVHLPGERSIATTADRAGGAKALEMLMDSGERVDAVVAYNDVVAFGVLHALKAHGLEPGSSIAVASFDNVADAVHQQPPLTSVDGFPEMIGRNATDRLLKRIKSPNLPIEAEMVTPLLRVRASTSAWVRSQLTAIIGGSL